MQPGAARNPRSETARRAEALAAALLVLEGYTVLGRNFRCAGVELDLVARRGDTLAIVEVKLRRPGPQRAGAALGASQWQRQRRAAAALLERCPWAAAVRLDVVAIDWDEERLVARHLRGVQPEGGRLQDT